MKRFLRFFQKNLRLGLRIIKTGIAVTFCIVLSHLLHLNQPFIAVISTVISMGKSIDLSVKTGKNKMVGVIIGSAAGTLCAAILPGNAGLCGIGIILSLYLCHLFHLESAGVLSSFAFTAVMFGASQDAPWKYALSCTVAAMLGIAVAVVVNLTVMPPNYAVEIKKAYTELKERTAAAIRDAQARNTIGTGAVEEEIEHLSRALQLYSSEAKVLRWNDDEVARVSSGLSIYRLVLDELKAVEVMELTRDSEPEQEILTVYRYHMNRMRELFQRVPELESA